MAHLLLVLHSTMNINPLDNTISELLDASLQALGSIAFFSRKALGLGGRFGRHSLNSQRLAITIFISYHWYLDKFLVQLLSAEFVQWSLVPSTLSAV